MKWDLVKEHPMVVLVNCIILKYSKIVRRLFTRDEFNRFYTSMQRQIDYINKIDLKMHMSEEWELLGYWPKILEKIHIIDKNIDTILTKEPSQQFYLDASLYNTVKSSTENLVRSKEKHQDK